MLECKQCKFRTSFVADLRHHMYKEHNAKKPRFHRCERCLEKYYSFDDLELHRSNSDCAQVHFSFDDRQDNQESSDADPLAKSGNNGVAKGTEGLPQLKLKRLSAEKIADYCKTVVSSKNLRKYFICSFCKGQYSQRSSLITHIKTLHEKLFLFKCSLCNENKEFNGKVLLNNHILYNHTNVRPFICSICGVSYAFKSVLISHLHSCLKKAPSGFTVVDLSKRASLNAYVTEEKIQVACPLCKAVCSNYIALIEHMKRHRNVQPTGKVRIAPPNSNPPPRKSKNKTNRQKNLYDCKLCSEVFLDLRRLISHTRKIHNSTLMLTSDVGHCPPPPLNQQATEKLYICEVCSKQFSNLQKLVTHKRMSHGSVPKKATTETTSQIQSPNDKLFGCDLCSSVFSYPQKLSAHKRMTHHVSKPRSANEEIISNGQKLYSCEVCSRDFGSLQKLVTHKRQHQLSMAAPAKRFRNKLKKSKGVHCNKINETDSSVNNNENNCNDSKVVIDQVVMETENVNELNCERRERGDEGGKDEEDKEDKESVVELRGSSGSEKVFACHYDNCEYASNNEANLKRHRKTIHKEGVTMGGGGGRVGEGKIHYCHVCPYETNMPSNLKRHLSVRHEIGDTMTCSFCSFQTINQQKFYTHVRIVHKVKPASTCKKCQRVFSSNHEMKCHLWRHLRQKTCCSDLAHKGNA